MATRDNTSGLLGILIGPGIWFACLGILYSIATAACTGLIGGDLPFAVASWSVVLASVAALTWTSVSERTSGASVDAPIVLLRRLLAVVSLIGVLWLLLPLAAFRAC